MESTYWAKNGILIAVGKELADGSFLFSISEKSYFVLLGEE